MASEEGRAVLGTKGAAPLRWHSSLAASTTLGHLKDNKLYEVLDTFEKERSAETTDIVNQLERIHLPCLPQASMRHAQLRLERTMVPASSVPKL